METMSRNQIIQKLLRNAIKNRLECEYLEKGASPSKRRYHEGRIAALILSLTDEPTDVLARSATRWTTEHHKPGDDITYPEGTYVEWMRGCIQAAQDVIRGDGEQTFDSPLSL